MPRRKEKDCAARTFLVHIPTYNAIREFFENSPSGITTSEACREVLKTFGEYCQEKLNEGKVAAPTDIAAINKIVLGRLTND
jgi:hypothetical protein